MKYRIMYLNEADDSIYDKNEIFNTEQKARDYLKNRDYVECSENWYKSIYDYDFAYIEESE